MPEGPEIRLAADAVADALVGRETRDIYFAFKRLRKYRRELLGQPISAVETRGKAILTCFDNDWVIYSHNQLYGRWYITPAGKRVNTGRQLRLALHNDEYSAWLYSASEIDVLQRQNLQQHAFLARIGPDLLSERPGVECIIERLRSPEFRNRQLAGLLLDQGFVAGLGNYLRAEILTLAKLHPSTKPRDCSARELRRLARQIIDLTERSYRTRGIINPPGLVKRLKAEGKTRREQYRFNTYGREGQACHYCGSAIAQNNAGGRKMYFCPGCQPPPKT